MRAGLIAALLAVSGCTNAFFQPSKFRFAEPADFPVVPREVFFASADGSKLHGWWFATTEKNAVGTVVQFHGNAENISTHSRMMLWLLKYGYNVFTFDYRGYGRSEGVPFFEAVRWDARHAIQTARGLSAPGTKIVLYGQSLGGVILIDAFRDWADPSFVDAIVLEGTFYAHQAVGRAVLSRHWLTWPFQWLSYLLVSNRHSPKRTLRRGYDPVPTLVLHSRGDPVMPFRQGEKLYDHLPTPKCFLPVAEQGHIGLTSLAGGKYREAVLRFLKDHSCPSAITPG